MKEFLKRIEPKWQKYWEDKKVFRAANPGEPGSEKPKYYCLDMFPYPSGEGLHIGHPLGYTATDIVSRYKRMRGFNVLHPMGWDAFGLPAEQHAIQKGIHPEITTKKNIQTFKRQLSQLGFSYDWSREISTIDPKYYKWTQWLFKRLYEKGLAYQAEVAVNWCPALGTVLANDEVIDGKSERGGHPVERRPMRQWVLKITAYADRLLKDLDGLDWPESTKDHQRNWIGKSEGAKIKFKAENSNEVIEVFTTRADTILGVTFIVLAPEHPQLSKWVSHEQKSKVDIYVNEAARKSDLQRTDLAKKKTGIFSGSYAIHPLSKERIPVWVADYVLANYGTGSIMGVPAHDERDKEFAETMQLPIVPVIGDDEKMLAPPVPGVYSSGAGFKEAAKAVVTALEKNNAGIAATTYKMRDWLFARQRYWGEPIPLIHILDGKDAGKVRLLEDTELPLLLPQVERYEPLGTGESPLAAVREWVDTVDPLTKAKAKRETNTMPGSAGSSWYYLRYMDPHNDKEPWSLAAQKYWGPVDFYLGGAEHAVGHLLYSRFWHKVFFDLGLVSTSEPFQKLVHQGMIQGEDGEKMSKSRGNVVNPDTIIGEYGADTLRLFEMFLGPLEKSKPWNTSSIEGVYRFLTRFWRVVTEEKDSLSPLVKDIPESSWPEPLQILFHKSIQSVTEDIEHLRFNTAVSTLMILGNEIFSYQQKEGAVPRLLVDVMTRLLAPFAPHTAEELWSLLGYKESIAYAAWPSFNVARTKADDFELAIQVNGKLRDSLRVSRSITEAELRPMVLEREGVKKWTEGKEPKKFIYVKEKLVSVVV